MLLRHTSTEEQECKKKNGDYEAAEKEKEKEIIKSKINRKFLPHRGGAPESWRRQQGQWMV